MRVSELADLVGTTVRTIRYYHQIGLLPVPETRDGRRDYDLTHVARLVRVRLLAQAGVPLSRIADMTAPGGPAGGDRASVLVDLEAALIALDEQQERLRERKERVQRLIGALRQHERLSPLPPAMARFYDAIEERAGDDGARRMIRHERDVMELAFYRGELPPQVEALYHGLGEERLAESAALFARIADRVEAPAAAGEEETAEIAAAVVDRVRRHLGDELPRLARSLDLDAARRAADLYVRFSAPKDRRLDRTIADALLAAIEEERTR
ncbi:MerR family transcriptional regulator [Actinomadura parmotrematis]|uniref:MerR family transcriptional regulator n=1 Tax=Actinomadura parmotrematis TaxID=2864039 RepID=A0ABS7G2J4_9ACTN|nr:MerR family transcriptional regulator [Actinomadura parmotrematis]MBW8486751.1 MerR family transcriptional regulator [Actinomadura parmotrematis]